jgi:hypothetical protein
MRRAVFSLPSHKESINALAGCGFSAVLSVAFHSMLWGTLPSFSSTSMVMVDLGISFCGEGKGLGF